MAHLPFLHLAACPFEQLASEPQDHPAALGQRDERIRRDVSQLRVRPAGERLEALHLPAPQVDDRLVVQGDLVAGDRLPEIGAQTRAVPILLAHGRLEHAQTPLAAPLGLIHGHVRMVEELLGTLGVRAERQPDARPDVDVPVTAVDRRGQAGEDPVRDRDGGGRVGAGQQDGELVPADTRDDVIRTLEGCSTPTTPWWTTT
jgi:hypothetical protein